jgi:hypothetical protein
MSRVGDLGRVEPGHRVRELIFGGKPLEELLQGAVLIAGVGVAVVAQQPYHPPFDVRPADLLPPGPAGIGEQVCGEPLDRLD